MTLQMPKNACMFWVVHVDACVGCSMLTRPCVCFDPDQTYVSVLQDPLLELVLAAHYTRLMADVAKTILQSFCN